MKLHQPVTDSLLKRQNITMVYIEQLLFFEADILFKQLDINIMDKTA